MNFDKLFQKTSSDLERFACIIKYFEDHPYRVEPEENQEYLRQIRAKAYKDNRYYAEIGLTDSADYIASEMLAKILTIVDISDSLMRRINELLKNNKV